MGEGSKHAGERKDNTSDGLGLASCKPSPCLHDDICFELWCFFQLMVFCYSYLSRVSKGVKGLPGSFKSTTSSVTSGGSLMYFGLFLASGVFLVFIAFTIFLPVMVIMPQKFAICFTAGCAFIIGSFFALKGPKNQLYHMISKEVLYLLSYKFFRLISFVIFLLWILWSAVWLCLYCF